MAAAWCSPHYVGITPRAWAPWSFLRQETRDGSGRARGWDTVRASPGAGEGVLEPSLLMPVERLQRLPPQEIYSSVLGLGTAAQATGQ